MMTNRHPFLLSLEFCFQTAGKLFFGMKFLQGGELHEHIKKKGRFPEEVAKFYAAQVLLGVEEMHSHNILWRDLKPENILLDNDGYIKLVDFGVSKRLKESTEFTSTYCGTTEYVSPEIVMGKPYDKRVDWWSFGVVLYEMVVGKGAFSGDHPNLVFRRIIEDEPEWPEDVQVSQELKDLVAKL